MENLKAVIICINSIILLHILLKHYGIKVSAIAVSKLS